MAKLLKILFGLLAVVLFLVVAAVVIVPMVVDPNDFRDDIAAQVKKHTGRDLTIGGEIGLSVFPWLGVELNQLSLSQPPAFGAEPFAEIKRAQVRAKLMPLLDKQLEVDTILLDGMRLRLIRNEQGTGNWEDLAQGGQDQPSEPQEAADEEGPAITGLTVGGIQVSDARVSWHDRQAAQQFTIENLDLETGKIMRDAPLDLDLSFVIDSQAPVFRGRISLQGTATPTQNNSRLEIAPLELRLSEARTGDGLTAQATVTAQALLDMAAQKYRIDGLRLEALAEGDQLPGGKLEARLQADATVDMADGTLDLPGFELHAAGLNLTGHLQGRSLDTAPSFNGKLSLAEINLRQWLQQRGLSEPQTADPQTLQKLSLNTGIQANAQEAGLENLRIILDDSTIEGNGRILLKEVPGYRFALSLDRIDLDRYLPPAAADADQSTQPPSAGEETAAAGGR